MCSDEATPPIERHTRLVTRDSALAHVLRRQQRTAEARPREHTRCGSTAQRCCAPTGLQHPPRCICGCSGEACSCEWERAARAGGGSRRGASEPSTRNQGTGNDNTKRGRGGSKKKEEARKLLLQETTRSCGERCLNTDTTGRHQQRWRGPETRSHRTAVVGKSVCTLYKGR
jgi:hypothetical protein